MLICLNNIEKSVPKGKGRLYLLRRISLTVSKGDFLTLVGPSGAGKSTLLSILGLCDANWQGEYQLAGNLVHELSHDQRQDLLRDQIGIVFQDCNLIDDLTVSENLELALNYHRMKGVERKARVTNILNCFNIVREKNRFPGQLSEDLQQLVAIGRALVKRPNVLLADEPTKALKSKQRRLVMNIFKELNDDGTTIIQATQDEINVARGNRSLNMLGGWLSE